MNSDALVAEKLPRSPICYLPLETSCGDQENDGQFFSYDSQIGSCRAASCPGDLNNFETFDECEAMCGRFHGKVPQEYPSISAQEAHPGDVDVCDGGS